jgi:hypothetical protein
VLSASVASQPFQAISRWNGKLGEVSDSMDLIKLPSDNLPQAPGTGFSSNGVVGAVKNILDASIPEGAYHGLHYNDTRDSHQLRLLDGVGSGRVASDASRATSGRR